MLLTTPTAELWLSQFHDAAELQLARKLLLRFRLVDANEFSRTMSEALERLAANGPVAVYIERELPMQWRVLASTRVRWSMAGERRRLGTQVTRSRAKLPLRMYKELKVSRGRGLPKKLRAEGAALPAVASRRQNRQEIGSEGVLATIATAVARRFTNIYVHPSATELRDNKIPRAVVLTDFIGSGTRASRMLDSLWYVRSVRSWWSGRKIALSVLAFAGTDAGIEVVQDHPSRPVVTRLSECPSIDNQFSGAERQDIEALCLRKAPARSEHPLGFGNAAALIAFEHSCPNNVPTIFWEADKRRRSAWHPLFPKRSTSEVYRNITPPSRRQRDNIALETLRMRLVSVNPSFQRMREKQRDVVLLVAALVRGHRSLDELATTTLLGRPELSAAIEEARSSGLVDQWRVTSAGQTLLRRLNRPARQVAAFDKPMYYPKSLRSLG